MQPRPNFFIAGAAKAGTTALHATLQQHPDIFMSAIKEPGFFSPDVSIPTSWNADPAAYLALFEAAGAAKIRGESSPAYLYSDQASARIAEFAPDAKILIVLRNPVDVIVATYAEARKWGIEPERSIQAALTAARHDRPAIHRPGGAWLRYFDVVGFADQVERYLACFPRSRLHIARYDDLVTDAGAFLRSVLNFLDVQPFSLTPGRHNPTHSYRSAVLQRLLMRPFADASAAADQQPHRLRRWLLSLNYTVNPPRAPDTLRAALTDEFAGDIQRLAQLADLDLAGWLKAG
jgi:hypothetical protein